VSASSFGWRNGEKLLGRSPIRDLGAKTAAAGGFGARVGDGGVGWGGGAGVFLQPPAVFVTGAGAPKDNLSRLRTPRLRVSVPMGAARVEGVEEGTGEEGSSWPSKRTAGASPRRLPLATTSLHFSRDWKSWRAGAGKTPRAAWFFPRPAGEKPTRFFFLPSFLPWCEVRTGAALAPLTIHSSRSSGSAESSDSSSPRPRGKLGWTLPR
jgi:hypothetical protein